MSQDLKRITNTLATSAKLSDEALSPERAGAVLRDACRAFEQVSEELRPGGRLSKALRILGARREATGVEYYEILRDAELFCEVFVHQESIALLQAGLSIEATAALMEEAQHLRTQLLEENRNHEYIRERIPAFRDSICEAASILSKGAYYDDSNGERHKWIRKSLLVAGGAATIAINAGTDAAASGGLLPVVSAISGEIGAGLIGAGLGG